MLNAARRPIPPVRRRCVADRVARAFFSNARSVKSHNRARGRMALNLAAVAQPPSPRNRLRISSTLYAARTFSPRRMHRWGLARLETVAALPCLLPAHPFFSMPRLRSARMMDRGQFAQRAPSRGGDSAGCWPVTAQQRQNKPFVIARISRFGFDAASSVGVRLIVLQTTSP